MAALTSWQYVTLFALKPVTHWFFGNSISLSTGEFVTATLDPLWTFGLAAAALLVALLGYSLASWCPRGSIPAAWGHIQTIADLVDDWGDETSDKLFWGDKGQPNGLGIRHAGTSSNVEDVTEPRIYSPYS